ncbi:MAG TPA: ABC transporter permease [Longimicrobiaceae bacterium]|nr:ABC transporter permease [Longimicrobiaceae bacterium]
MAPIPGIRRIFRLPTSGATLGGEVDDEIAFHLERRAEELAAGGMSPAAARAQAHREFGDAAEAKRELAEIGRRRLRRERRTGAWDALRQDAAFALRTLRRSPGFSAVAVLTLALAVGANTAIFSAVSGVLLRPLPFADPDRLVMLWEENPEKDWHAVSAAPANLLDWREQVPAFQDVAGYAEFADRVTLTGAGEPQALSAAQVTGNFFSVLGVRAEHGRTLRDEETWAGPEPVAVISRRAWIRSFGADPEVVGRVVQVDGRPVRVVGVVPPGIDLPVEGVDVWLPMAWDPAARQQTWFRRAHWVRPVARLRPGVPLDAADAQLQTVVRRLQAQYPETNRLMGAGMTPLHEFLVGDTRTPLLVLLGAVGLLLLLACANVGNLLLVRATGRQRELAVRSALGAGRRRLVRQVATESLVLSAVAGGAGLLLGWGGTRVLGALRPPELLAEGQIALDWRVLVYTLAVTAASGLLFGLVPAAWTSRAPLGQGLRAGGRATGLGRNARRVTGALVVAEVAVALLLVVGAGLLLRSFRELREVEPGFESRGVLAVTLVLPAAEYDTDEKVAAFYGELVRRAGALPGVVDAGAVRKLPLTDPSWSSDFSVAGRGPDEYGVDVLHREVTPGYFRTLRVPLLRGRGFTPADRAGAPMAVVVNEALARRYFPGEDPVGQRIAFDRVPDESSVWRTIVGVVGSERQDGLADEPRPEIFAPVAQDPTRGMVLVLRAHGDPMTLAPAVRRTVAGLDPDLVPYEVQTLDGVRADSIARQRFLMALLAAFAGVALVLALVGVYGVLAQAVRQRAQEMGIRLALGARPRDVLWLVVRHGLALVAAGIGVGLGAALVATRAVESLLYGVRPTDPPTFAAVAGLLALAGLAAGVVPALRASRTEPATVLRAE